jgi:NAD(P)H-hydrate epimerase
MGAMISGYSAEQIRAAEAPHLAAGVPLMARAAAGLAREILALLPGAGGRILLLVGSGDNGGDTLYAGEILATADNDVSIVTTGTRVHSEAMTAALSAGCRRENVDAAAGLAARADVVVDGILGTGTSANPALRGGARDLVEAVLPVVSAPRHPIVVAVDIPSGINPNDGSVPPSRASVDVAASGDVAAPGSVAAVLPADVTVTFGGYKAGLLIPPASQLAGRVVLVDIGLGPDLATLEPVIQVPGDEP